MQDGERQGREKIREKKRNKSCGGLLCKAQRQTEHGHWLERTGKGSAGEVQDDGEKGMGDEGRGGGEEATGTGGTDDGQLGMGDEEVIEVGCVMMGADGDGGRQGCW